MVIKIEIIKKATNKIRIIHLLTHSSGIGSGDLGVIISNNISDEENNTLKDAVCYFSKQPIEFEPYTMNSYSPTAGFDILARIIEIVSGLSFYEYLKIEIFEPLGMVDTTFCPSDEQKSRLVDMHKFENGIVGIKKMPENCVFENIPNTHFCGGAGLISTINDYSKLARMLLFNGEFNGVRILKPKTVKSLSIPHIPECMNGSDRWSLGMRVITDESYKIRPIGSFGWSGAYGTHFWVDPINKITAVYMKNSQYDGGSGSLTGHNMEMDVYLSLES